MGLKEILKSYSANYIGEIPYLKINGFIFSYCCLNGRECFSVCLNKPLLHLSDLSLINKNIKGIGKIQYDNIAYKHDLLYIFLDEYDDIEGNLNEISEMLISLNYSNRKHCILCGKISSLNLYKKIIAPVDENCLIKLYEDEKQTEIIFMQNYKKSLLNTIFASLIGIIPSIILSYVLGSYSVMATMLLFLSPFLAMIFFYKSKIDRSKKTDLTVFIISFSFIVLYHFILILMFSILYQIKSFNIFINNFNLLLIEALIETIVFFLIGYLSSSFLVKKRRIRRLEKQKKHFL